MTETDIRPAHSDTGTGTPRHAHIVRKRGGSADAMITEAVVMGNEVEALCGYRWVPSRDPSGLPVCPACREVLANMP